MYITTCHEPPLCKRPMTLRIIFQLPIPSLLSGKMTDWGHILHGTARVLRRHLGRSWPEHVAVLDLDVLEHLQLLKLQGYPDIMIVLLILEFAFEYPLLCLFDHFSFKGYCRDPCLGVTVFSEAR